MAKTYKSTRVVKHSKIANASPNNTVEESAAIYYTTINPIQSILNITTNFQNEMDLVLLSRNGVLKQAVNNMAAKFGITQEKICELLHMSARNFQRIKDNSHLDIYTSEQTIEMATVYAKAYTIFSTEDAIKNWFQAPNYALGNQKPIDLLDTSFGVKMVTDVLGRIEHGIYS